MEQSVFPGFYTKGREKHMKVMGRDNNVKAGFLSYPGFAERLLSSLSDEAIGSAIPDEVLRSIERVIITGNGDSYAAALGTREFNSRMFLNKDYHVERCIDVSRHYVFPTIAPEKTLVIVISVSGGGARATEAMMRARKKGCTTLAITSNPESRMAKEAEYILKIMKDKPSEFFTPSDQTKNYFTAVLTTIMFALHAGKLFGTVTSEEAEEQKREVQRYVDAVCNEAVLESVDNQMYELSETWKDYLGYDFVGGGSDFATAYFGDAKFFELCGSLNCLNDSEDWCHIDYFQTNRDKIGTVAVASRCCASFTRTVETVASMKKSSRNVLVIADTPADEFIEGVSVCTLPAAKFGHITPLMNFIPLFMLGNYIAIKRGYEYFGGMDDSNPLFSQEGGINTIKSSRIEYYE